MDISSCDDEQPCWRKYCDLPSVVETCRENQRLQQEKDDLKMSFIQSEFSKRYLQYLRQERTLWPSVKDTEEKLAAATKERRMVKDAFEQEKDRIKDVLQLVATEYDRLQEKKRSLENKQKIFEEKRTLFETKLGIKPDLARAAIDKCQQAIGRLEREIEACSAELSTLETACCDLQARLRAQRSRPGAGSAEQMLQRGKKVLKFLETMTGVTVGDVDQDSIQFNFTNTSDTTGKPSAEPVADDLSLTLTVGVQTSSDGSLRLTAVKTNIDGLKIQDIVDVAIATSDLPYLIRSVKDRWTHHFPLLSEIEILNKHHAIDWIEEQSRLRLLVGKCGRVMFTLSVPEDYPVSRKISLINSYGVDKVEESELPDENATLLQWVTFLENKYGDCE